MIKNIVFDMGNVLISYNPERYIEKYCGDDEDDKRLLLQEVFQGVEWIRTDRGTMTDEEAVMSICRRVPHRLHKTVEALFCHWHEDIPPVAGMEELILRLKEAGYRIYILSNTCRNYHSFRKRLPAIEYFDGEFISADWRLLKPSREIYQTFCSHFRLVPAECFFIDDMPANIEGAMEIGMNGFIFRGDLGALEDALKDAGVLF